MAQAGNGADGALSERLKGVLTAFFAVWLAAVFARYFYQFDSLIVAVLKQARKFIEG